MYTQVIGCIIMGFTTQHKKYFSESPRKARIKRVIYIAITTGLCGSITTFSTWQMESFKNFMLQWDVKSNDSYSSSNGGRLIEWIISLWIGVVLPLLALHLGQHLALLSPINNSVWYSELPVQNISQSKCDDSVDFSLVVVGIFSTLLVILIPTMLYPTWEYITYTAVFGALGAYSRYKLSQYNTLLPHFPVGTYVANVSGTWLLALITLLSKAVVGYYDVVTQGILYGVAVGFCGCLTTVSTLVNEIDSLPTAASYRYGIATTVSAQTGLIFIYGVYVYSLVPPAMTRLRTYDECSALTEICNSTLVYWNCPRVSSWIDDCTDDQHPTALTNHSCRCGDFDISSAVRSNLVQSLVADSVTSATVSVWPTELYAREKSLVVDPTATIDVCLSFEYLALTGCHPNQRRISGCGRHGIGGYQGSCGCGSQSVGIGEHLMELLLARTLSSALGASPLYTRRSDFVSALSTDFNRIFGDYCEAALEVVNCPLASAYSMASTTIPKPANSFAWSGSCACGRSFDVTNQVVGMIAGRVLLEDTVVTSASAPGMIGCVDYRAYCTLLLDSISCPLHLRRRTSCGNCSLSTTASPQNSSTAGCLGWGPCSCGPQLELEEWVKRFLVAAAVDRHLGSKYVHREYVHNPYVLLTQSNPYKQLQ